MLTRPLPISTLATAWLLSCCAALRAQGGDPLPIPARVRVLAPPLVRVPVVATITARRPDSLLLDIPAQGPLSIPLVSVQRVEISRGKRANTATGALVGLLVGGAATAAFLAGFCGGDTLCETDEVVRAFAIIAAPPTLVGALIGSAVRTEHWERVSPDRFGLTSAHPPELRLGLRVRVPSAKLLRALQPPNERLQLAGAAK